MANPACMNEGCPNESIFIGTIFETGQSIVVCSDHFIQFCAGMLEAMTGVPVTMLITLPPEVLHPIVNGISDLAPNDGPTSPESSEAGTVADPDEAERLYNEWLFAHREQIEAHMADGLTFEEAVADVQADELATVNETAHTPATN